MKTSNLGLEPICIVVGSARINDICEKELQLIHEKGLRLGLNPQAVNEVLLKMNDFPNKMLPREMLISIFKTFHN